MKVMIIHHSGDIGGGTLSCFDIVRALMENGHEVKLVLPPGNNDARILADKLGFKVINSNLNPITFNYYNGGSNLLRISLKYFFVKKFGAKWKNLFEKEAPDLVMLNSSVQWPMISILNSLYIKNICFIRETMRGERNSLINRIIAARIEKSYFISFISNFDKNQWNLSSNVNQIVIPDMVDSNIFLKEFDKFALRKKYNLEESTFYVLYVGGMNEFKGASVIIEAMKYCKSENIKLLFLGDIGTEINSLNFLNRIKNRRRIEFINEMKKYIQDNDLVNSINLIGKQTNMNDWYAISDVVVFPAIQAHQARPIYESGAFNKTIIVSDFPNYKEYINHLNNGLVFEPKNPKKLADAIKTLYSNSSLRKGLAENNYRIMKNNHSSIEVNKKINTLVARVYEQNCIN